MEEISLDYGISNDFSENNQFSEDELFFDQEKSSYLPLALVALVVVVFLMRGQNA